LHFRRCNETVTGRPTFLKAGRHFDRYNGIFERYNGILNAGRDLKIPSNGIFFKITATLRLDISL
jgi:hypothetical protein